MLDIPNDFPLHKLVSQELMQLCIGSNDIVLRFYQRDEIESMAEKWKPGATIAIDSGFELSDKGRVICAASNEDLGNSAGGLTVLLRQIICSVERLPRNELLLRFSKGHALHLVTDEMGYESFHIELDGDMIDVAAPFSGA
ncbi:hypothetical protein [Inhella crocodyli]|uniref:Uncharacterized protein n=1 Tax=Inhella crocodyli TaxID=2499851 RepID=A0A3S2UG16_9BURK|nr:hypothetical protein [Inhella crocodyli]RVT84906.1 hypothetical protein EOD73_12345 [Inhella crocodyli]